MSKFLHRLKERVLNEPALLLTAVAAVAALFGVDAAAVEEQYEPVVKLLVLLAGGGAIRQVVRPERKVPSYVEPVETDNGLV